MLSPIVCSRERAREGEGGNMIFIYICVYICIYWAILGANAQPNRMLEGKGNRGRGREYDIHIYMCIHMYILGYIGRECSAAPYARGKEQ